MKGDNRREVLKNGAQSAPKFWPRPLIQHQMGVFLDFFLIMMVFTLAQRQGSKRGL